MGLSGLFEISRRSLTTFQQALNVTSNNIANANNPGYSRRQVVLGTLPPDNRSTLSVGMGVKIEQITRARDRIADAQIISYNQENAYSKKQSSVLGHIETVFSEPSELGLSNMINQFFTSWEELTVNPSSSPLRTNVIQSTEKMASKIESITDSLKLLKGDLRQDAENLTQEMNRYIGQVEELNKQIYDAEVVGKSAFDLLDKRTEVLRELSKMANINVTYDDKNVANLSIGGIFAADRISSVKFKAEIEDGKVFLKTEDGQAKVKLTGGEMFAVTNSYNKLIPEYESKIDTIASTIFTKVNEYHLQGYSDTNPQLTGLNFFESYSEGVLKINKEIVRDPSLLAVSADGTPGNSDIALRIAGFKDEKVLNGKTVQESYNDFISNIGNLKMLNDQKTDASTLVIKQLDLQQAEISGVNIDEEMIDILKFQRSYDASAKLIGIADEMLQTLLNMV